MSLAAPACSFGRIDLNGRLCSASDQCAAGYSCETTSRSCVLGNGAIDVDRPDAGALDAGTDVDRPDVYALDAGTDVGRPDTGALDAPRDDTGLPPVTLTIRFADPMDSIERVGTGPVIVGTLAGTLETIACGPASPPAACTLSLSPGDVALRVAAPWMTVTEWDVPTCSRGSRTCTVSVLSDTMLTVTAHRLGNLAFVTRATFAATALEVASQGAADTACTLAARSGQLPGAYLALLNDTGGSWARLSPADAGWLRLDGEPLSLTTEPIGDLLLHPIAVDEYGVAIPIDRSVMAWMTAPPMREADGFYYVGGVLSTSIGATAAHIDSTAVTPFLARLYCFEIPGPGYATLTRPGRDNDAVYLFVSSSVTGMLNDRGALNARCEAEATAVGAGRGLGLPGRYRALLGSSGAGFLQAIDMHPARIERPTAMVRRSDHYPLATLRDFATTNPLRTTPSLLANGTESPDQVATGASFVNPSFVGVQHCENWTAPPRSYTTSGVSWVSSWTPTSIGTPAERDRYSEEFGSFAATFSQECVPMDPTPIAVYCYRYD